MNEFGFYSSPNQPLAEHRIAVLKRWYEKRNSPMRIKREPSGLAQRWVQCMHSLAPFTEMFHIVRYEDLVQSPADVLATVGDDI